MENAAFGRRFSFGHQTKFLPVTDMPSHARRAGTATPRRPEAAAQEMIRQEKGGRSAIWQRYEEATMCQRRPADPTDPGDAADLSIMGYSRTPGLILLAGAVHCA